MQNLRSLFKKIIPATLVMVVVFGFSQHAHAGVVSSVTGIDPEAIWQTIIMGIGTILLTISSWILWASGVLLDAVMKFTVVNMSANIGAVDGINIAWKVFRDIANMFFIFILLYIAIGTILRLGGINMQKMIRNVIVVALLLNFSLFFTKIIIDASNILTIGFYNKITQSADAGSSGAVNYSGLSAPFMNKLGVTSIFDPEGIATMLANQTGNTKMFLVSIMGSLFFIITACVFFGAGFLFIARYIKLIFLLFLSPLAFASIAIPKYNYFDRWWKPLVSECLFAPVFMALTWAVLTILGSIVQSGTQGSLLDSIAGAAGGSPGAASGATIMNFVIIIALITATLIISKELGASGASRAMNMKNWAQGKIGDGFKGGLGFASRNTVGRAASKIAESERFKDIASKSVVGNFALKRTEGVAAGYNKRLAGQVKERTDRADNLGYNKDKVYEQEQALRGHQARLAIAQALPTTNLGRAAAIAAAEADIRTTKSRVAEIKTERQKNFARTTNKRSVDTLWFKTARKDKAAAAKIQTGVLKAEIERIEKDINEIKPDLRDLEKKDKAGIKNANGQQVLGPGGTPVSGLNAAEQAELADLKNKKANKETDISMKKLEISNLETVS